MEEIKTQKRIRAQIYAFLQKEGLFITPKIHDILKGLLQEYLKVNDIKSSFTKNKNYQNYKPEPITDKDLDNIE